MDAKEITLKFYKYNTASPAQDLCQRNISGVCIFIKALIYMNKTLSGGLPELSITMFRSQFKGSLTLLAESLRSFLGRSKDTLFAG